MENVKIMTDCLLNPEIHDKITAPIHGHFFDCSTVAIHKRKLKFLTKLPHSKNTKCTLCVLKNILLTKWIMLV